MKAQLGALLLFFAVPAAFAGVISQIPPDSQTVLTSQSTWKPSPEQRQKALTHVQEYLEKKASPTGTWEAKKLAEILHHPHGYRVQFQGISKNGDRLVICNFLPGSPDKLEPKDRHHEEVLVDDGGTNYWTAEYDPLTDRVRVYEIGIGQNDGVRSSVCEISFTLSTRS